VALNGGSPAVVESRVSTQPTPDTFFFGGSSSLEGTFEGRLDEIAVFDRPLSDTEIAGLFRAGGGAP